MTREDNRMTREDNRMTDAIDVESEREPASGAERRRSA